MALNLSAPIKPPESFSKNVTTFTSGKSRSLKIRNPNKDLSLKRVVGKTNALLPGSIPYEDCPGIMKKPLNLG